MNNARNIKSVAIRKVAETFLILASACSLAIAQTPETCEAQLRHFTVHDYGSILKKVLPPNGPYGSGNPRPIYAKMPSRLLFSDRGLEVYVSIPAELQDYTFCEGCGSDFLSDASSQFSVLIVYQTKSSRQAEIAILRSHHVLPPPGFGALLSNLKYEKVTFTRDSLEPATQSWHISHIEFDQPEECNNVFQNDVHPTLEDAYSTTVSQIAYSNETKDVRWSVKSPLLSRALQAGLAWIKECAKVMNQK